MWALAMSSHNPLSQRANLAGGQPISELMRLALARPELISLAAGFVDQASLPVDRDARRWTRVLSDPRRGPGRLCNMAPTPGYLPLREAVLTRLLAADGGAWHIGPRWTRSC